MTRRLIGDPMFWPPPDQSWAKSVRWSCGRPGYRPLFDWREAWERALWEDRARYYASIGFTLQPDCSLIVASAT